MAPSSFIRLTPPPHLHPDPQTLFFIRLPPPHILQPHPYKPHTASIWFFLSRAFCTTRRIRSVVDFSGFVAVLTTTFTTLDAPSCGSSPAVPIAASACPAAAYAAYAAFAAFAAFVAAFAAFVAEFLGGSFYLSLRPAGERHNVFMPL